MSDLGVRIELVGYTALRARLEGASEQVQREAVQVIHTQLRPMQEAMEAATFTKIQKHAFNAVDIHPDSLGAEIRAPAKGTEFDQVLFFGGEFGGRKNKKVVYTRRSPRGVAHIVRRRTTMQFLQHLGGHGWFMFPTLRAWVPKIQAAVAEHVAKAL